MARARLGHALLLVRDVERSMAFYADVFERNALGPDDDRVGLLHLEFDVPNKRCFAEVVRRLVDRGVELEPVDHRISWGAYFCDPDGNGLEIGCDTRHEPDGAEVWEGTNRPLALDSVLGLLETT